MASIGRRDLLLLLISLKPDGDIGEEIGGVTRLQKLLFLLEKEEGLTPKGDGFEFTAYKAGPYSSKLYDDVEFLENLGLLQSEIVAEATDVEAAEVARGEAEIDRLSFEQLIGDEDASPRSDPDVYEERRFRLTPKGLGRIKKLLESGEYEPVVDGVRKVKSRYSSHSLNDLLYHVYTNYPEMTEESEIKAKVLGRSRR
jgi:hypothetical protein